MATTYNNAADHQATQYNVLTGGASNILNNVAPSSTSGVPLISQGSSSQPLFGTAVVAGGGTGLTSATAYAVLCGGTSSTSALQSIAGVGTSGQVLTSNGAGALPTFQASGGSNFAEVVIQTFTSSGTYTPTSGMQYCIIEVVGGGGGSGGLGATSGTQGTAASGGGGGGYSKGVFSSATIGANQSVTVGTGGSAGTNAPGAGGTGGTTSVGSLISATGGAGSAASSGTTQPGAAGGVGGVGSSGSVNCNGGAGGGSWGQQSAIGMNMGGQGGNSIFGGGSTTTIQCNNTGFVILGVAGTLYGGGASGGSTGPSQAHQVGAAGAAGVVVITEFVN
jgi:hypothetical protein